MRNWKPDVLPLYGCLTGIEVSDGVFDVAPGVQLRRVFVDMFGTSMLAFAPPPGQRKPHPGPWVPVQGGYTFKSRVEVAITDVSAFDGLSPSLVAWLVVAMLRLQMTCPVRMAVLANAPFDSLRDGHTPWPIAFESSINQIGLFKAQSLSASEGDLQWLRGSLLQAARLYHDERFMRAFSVYDQAQWSPSPEMAAILVWTSIEALFDLGAEREKTKAICRALSNYVGADLADRDRAYQVVRDLYAKRGSVVHVGQRMPLSDLMQSLQLAKVAFRRCIIDGELPPSRARLSEQ